MYDPSMRVLTVLELLQARGAVTGGELAERLEVSPRTVQRYVARLRDLGLPVEATRGPGGTYRLKPGFRVPPLMLGTEEAFALALGLDALTFLGLTEVAPAAAGVRAKLGRVLPAAVAERVGAMRTALLLEPPRRSLDADLALLIELATAVQACRRVRLRYQAGDGALTARTVEPLGLMQLEGRWFLAAYCLLRQDQRLFRVDRVRAAERLAESFARPADFDLAAFVYQRLVFAAAPWQVEVWLDAPPESVEPRLPRAFAVLETEGTGTRLRCSATLLEEIALLLLQVGCAIEVRTPPELVDAFRAVAQRALAIGTSAP